MALEPVSCKLGRSICSFPERYKYKQFSISVNQRNLRGTHLDFFPLIMQIIADDLFYNTKFLPDFFEGLNRFIQMRLFVACRKLNSDSCLPFGYDREIKSDNINTLFQKSCCKVLR